MRKLADYHQLNSLLLALIFPILLQQLSYPVPVFRFLLGAFLLFEALVVWYNRAYLKAIGRYDFWVLVRPVLLFLSAFCLFLVLPSGGFRLAFLMVTVPVTYFVEYFLGNFAENILLNETLLVVFGLLVAAAAYNQYFPAYHTLYLAGVFLSVAVVSRAFYQFIPHGERDKIAASVLIALVIVELFWAMSFLPLHFSATGLVLFNVYYCCLVLTYHQLYGTLTPRKVQFHLAFMVVCALTITLITPWRILT